MTNNPTIDGVSRERAADSLYLTMYPNDTLHECERGNPKYEACLKAIDAGYVKDAHVVECHQHEWDINEHGTATICSICGIRSSDAPVVERQDDGFNGDNAHLVRCIDALLSLDAKGAMAPHGIGGHARTLLKSSASRLSTPPEVAALQSTIAQLQARIAELESGRGDPVAWLAEAVGPDGTAYRRTSSTTQITMRDVKYAWGEGVVSKYEIKIQPVFTAPPAPVSDKYDEVLLPFLAMMRNELHANAGKGDRPGWLSMTPGECLLEIYYHLGKLQKGVKDGNELWITEYSADVANMAMMLADICACLDATTALNGLKQ